MSKSLFVYAKEKSLIVRFVFAFMAILMSGYWLLPMMTGTAEAATGQMTVRSLTISSAVAGATGVTYTFSFRTATNNQPIYAFKFEACTTAVGTYTGGSCTSPTNIHFDVASYNSGAEAGFTDSTNHFALDSTGQNDCLSGASHPNVLCIKRATTTGNDTNVSTNKTIQFTAVTNPTDVNTAFYVGITDYNNATYSTASNGIIDTGTTATAIVQSLTISARVAELLNFCIGSTSVNDSTSSVPNGCVNVSGNTVNIGTLDSGRVNTSPDTSDGGNSENGIAMVRSNAANGVGIYYDAITQGVTGTNHLGTLRITGATCSATNTNSDGCINAIGTTQTPITAGTEDFGMTIAGVNPSAVTPSSYSCAYGPSGNTCNLEPQANYLGAGTAGSSEAYGTTNGFAWDDTGASHLIASSANSTIKQVDDEALILAFAATSNIITPFGSYSVQADFTAVPSY